MKPIEVIGHVEIKSIEKFALQRQQMQDVLNTPIDGLNIITTNQTRDVEMYGWQSPIKNHVDGVGYIFFMPFMIAEHDTLKLGDMEVELKVGDVVCFNDCVPHETLGKGNVLALFRGPYHSHEINDGLKHDIVASFHQAING